MAVHAFSYGGGMGVTGELVKGLGLSALPMSDTGGVAWSLGW